MKHHLIRSEFFHVRLQIETGFHITQNFQSAVIIRDCTARNFHSRFVKSIAQEAREVTVAAADFTRQRDRKACHLRLCNCADSAAAGGGQKRPQRRRRPKTAQCIPLPIRLAKRKPSESLSKSAGGAVVQDLRLGRFGILPVLAQRFRSVTH